MRDDPVLAVAVPARLPWLANRMVPNLPWREIPMSPTVILISVFAVFIPALILPGPDFIAVVRSSMTKGTAAGLLTTIGVSTGLGMYATLSLLGLSAVLVEYH